MKNLKPFILLVTILANSWVFAQNKTVQNFAKAGKFVLLDITGKKYENMTLKVVSTTPKAFYVVGNSIDKSHWTFNIPDSISQNIWNLQFTFTSKKEKQGISFAGVINNDTLSSQITNFENNSDTLVIKGAFLKTDPVSHNDILKIEVEEKTYMMESMKYPGFAFFSPINKQKKYEDFMNEYILKIKDNPNSSYYITYLSAALAHFNSMADIRKLFDLFSTPLKDSDHGKRIEEYINFNPVFENISLPLVNNENKQEALIIDSTKYNLIQLTASWCGSCHKIIPTLKEISEQYKDNLIITYVTIDRNEKGIVDFWKHIKKENIIWRSLWLKDSNDSFLRRRVNTTGIPSGILVNRDGKIVDFFNFNRPEDVKKFHSILQAK